MKEINDILEYLKTLPPELVDDNYSSIVTVLYDKLREAKVVKNKKNKDKMSSNKLREEVKKEFVVKWAYQNLSNGDVVNF